ncbi:hypothetical protein LAG90_15685 [Marinilongibacter aquaticus]|uniref:hypothetical protein n=1 Tax=Marinilongibacter aquaticus TaxID=2975157 RepID=UPI0021BDA83C|nr:hypothetical protein [Marinilongibacter aquaticus]UBM58245.1 hypothetical protein LAG90_15685 [Marinilongibacter aquaticus]
MEEKPDINAKQAKFLKSRAERKSFNDGQGLGKWTVMGLKVGSMWLGFPRKTWVVVGLTYVQINSIVVPAIRKGLELLGFNEYDPKHQPYGVFVVQSQPPKHWRSPYIKPDKKIYQYCITFMNGFTIVLRQNEIGENPKRSYATQHAINVKRALENDSIDD